MGVKEGRTPKHGRPSGTVPTEDGWTTSRYAQGKPGKAAWRPSIVQTAAVGPFEGGRVPDYYYDYSKKKSNRDDSDGDDSLRSTHTDNTATMRCRKRKVVPRHTPTTDHCSTFS